MPNQGDICLFIFFLKSSFLQRGGGLIRIAATVTAGVIGIYVAVAVLKTVFWLTFWGAAAAGGFWLWRRSGGNPMNMQREVQQAVTRLR